MRTLQQLKSDLRRANVDDVAELAGVSTKTIYRIRTGKDYQPRLGLAITLDAILNRLVLAEPERPKPAAITTRKQKAEAT